MFFQNNNLAQLARKRAEIAPYKKLIAAGDYFTVGVRSDGRVLFTGKDDYGLRNVQGWRDIKAVVATGEASSQHIVGLKANGTVVAIGDNDCGQCNTETWHNIIDISVAESVTIGLCSDGTIVFTGNVFSEDDLLLWNGITNISAGDSYTVGIQKDKSVIISSFGLDMMQYNNYDISSLFFNDFVNIDTRQIGCDIVGLHEDGTVTAFGRNDKCQNNTLAWNDIVDIAAGLNHTLGLYLDGTVIATGDNSLTQCNIYDWKNVIALSASSSHSVALCDNGIVLSTGSNYFGECNTYDWKLF